MRRRKFLQYGLYGLGGLSLPMYDRLGSARAQDETDEAASEDTDEDKPPPPYVLRIHCDGGWDQTLVFEDKSGSPNVATDASASVANGSGGIEYVSAPSRPSVDTFFANHGDKSCIVNGLFSKAMERQMALRDTMGVVVEEVRTYVYDYLDYYAFRADKKLLAPYLVFNAPYFPGESEANSFYINQRILNTYSTTPTGITGVSSTAQESLDKFLEDNHKSFAKSLKSKGIDRLKAESLKGYLEKEDEFATAMQSIVSENLTGTESDLLRDSKIALQMMERGLSYCATVQDGANLKWDTPRNTTTTQSSNFDSLFSDLNQIISYAGDIGIDDNLIIVVTSEAGRSPRLNSYSGKDRWPFTSALAWGKFIAPGAVVGATDDYLRGIKIDPIFGLLDSARATILNMDNLFSALYFAGNINYAKFLKGVDYLSIMLKVR